MPRAARKVPDAEQLEREKKALELRRAGIDYDAIATEVGYASRSGAYQAVQRALARVVTPGVDELRTAEVDRLDRLQAAMWWLALKGDTRAVDRVLRISAERSKLLGLYAPVKTELTVSLDEQQAALIVSAVAAILADLKLTPDQQALAGEVVPRHLAAVESPKAS